MVKSESMFRGRGDFGPAICYTDDPSFKSKKSSRINAHLLHKYNVQLQINYNYNICAKKAIYNYVREIDGMRVCVHVAEEDQKFKQTGLRNYFINNPHSFTRNLIAVVRDITS